jgi:hypothetical protein
MTAPTPERLLPRYPIFVPSKGRADICLTAKLLTADAVPFRLVVEAAEADVYRSRFPAADIRVLPFENAGSVIPARNWIREQSIAEGFDRHWQLDDNIRTMRRMHRGHRIRVTSAIALRVCEDFTDRYTNVGVSGLNYKMFVTPKTVAPYFLNCHVYSCCLINNRMPYHWRGCYNEDTDLCLQVLSAGLCTFALNVFMADKEPTLTMKGGNTDALYQGDGRLKMARSLERLWPYAVTTRRRFGRPQHIIRDAWHGFDTPLIRRTDINWDELPAVDEYGLRLIQLADEIRSPAIQALIDDADSSVD